MEGFHSFLGATNTLHNARVSSLINTLHNVWLSSGHVVCILCVFDNDDRDRSVGAGVNDRNLKLINKAKDT